MNRRDCNKYQEAVDDVTCTGGRATIVETYAKGRLRMMTKLIQLPMVRPLRKSPNLRRAAAQSGRTALPSSVSDIASAHNMANRGYDVVVDVDQEVCSHRPLNLDAQHSRFQGDLGHTDLQEDLEFHSSSTRSPPRTRVSSMLT